ncbi:MAG: J domain-containing protein [Myxococcales bacterium]|nr:J domain-containing protein [Myxococcales bacterium]
MKGRVFQSATLEDVEVECTHCGVTMTPHLGSGCRVRYFRCASCHRWVSSAYAEVFRADAKVRRNPMRAESGHTAFERAKDRLERWLASAEEQDPHVVLGVSPLDPPELIRVRYRELALANHPDRGGSAEKMRELNLAYERILQHRERRGAESVQAGSLRALAAH